MSLDAVDRQQMPFVGETGGRGTGDQAAPGTDADTPPAAAIDRAPGAPGLPLDPTLTERLAEARRRADEHLDHDVRRAPRPDRMQR